MNAPVKEEVVEADHKTVVVVPVWILKAMITQERESELLYLRISHRRDANEHRGRRLALESICQDAAFLELGARMQAELAAAQKPPCHHVWIDVTLTEDEAGGATRKLCQVCGEVALELVDHD